MTMYAGVAFIIIELVGNVAEPLNLPDWFPTVVILLLIIGFPITIILSWIFDITPEGVKKTESANDNPDREEVQTGTPAKKVLSASNMIIAGLVVVVCILLYPKIFKKDLLNELRDAEGLISLAVLPFDPPSANPVAVVVPH